MVRARPHEPTPPPRFAHSNQLGGAEPIAPLSPIHPVSTFADMRPLLLVVLFASSPLFGNDILPEEIPPGIPKSEMMSEWLKAKAFESLDRREAAFEALETNEDLERWQAERREFFLRQIGELPERTPLNPKVTGAMEFDGYRIEKLYFESQPGLHVTGTLYLPDGDGPFPGVIHPTGHSASAKKRDLYQQASIVIARGGCAVLCYDPIGQGERRQVLSADGEPFPTTLEHMLINQGAHLLGSGTARTMIWDGMRAIDYLQSRPDIDGEKIGCTGISGGGTNTSYLMALDDRVVAAAPGCYLTGFRSLLSTIGPQDAEQNIHGQIAFGMDHADYVLMRLPKPTLIMAATGDYFDIGGAWRLFREGKRFATRQGFPERVSLVEPATDHGFPPEMRLGAAHWMRRWLVGDDEPVGGDGEPEFLEEEELNSTPTGSVLDLDGARTIFEINADRSVTFAEERNGELDLEKVRERIGARTYMELPDPVVRSVGEDAYVLESDRGIYLPVRLIDGEGAHTIVLGEAEALTTGPVLKADLRGLGETSKVTNPKDAKRMVGHDWADTTMASLLGKSYVGMRVEDIWQIVRAWRQESGDATLTPDLVATGEAAIPALHAAALEPELFGKVRLSGMIDSWTEVVETPLARHQQANLVFGALRDYDLPMLRKVLGDKLTTDNFVAVDFDPTIDSN